MRTRNILVTAIGILWLAFASGCAVTVRGQEIRVLRTDANNLEVLMIYRGVFVPKDAFLMPHLERQKEGGKLNEGVTIAESFLQGRRIGMALGWPFLFDLEDEEVRAELPEETVIAIDMIQLVKHGAFLDDANELCAYQHYRIRDLSGLLGALNEAFRQHLQGEIENGTFESGLGMQDAETVALWRNRVFSKEPWINFANGTITLDIPMSQAFRLRLIEEGLDALLDVDALKEFMTAAEHKPNNHAEMKRVIKGLAAHLKDLRIGEDRIAIDFRIPAGEELLFLSLMRDGVEYDSGLRDALEERGHDFSQGLGLSAVQSTFTNRNR